MDKKIILDWNEYTKTAVETTAEGCVLLKNDNNALPLKKDCTISVFGRIALHYYKSGTGSGGMVNVSKVTGIIDGLRESGLVKINDKLFDLYSKWNEENPFDEGLGWGNEPWSQAEMPITDELAKNASENSDCAIVIIGRTAGEDKDSSNTKGAYLLTDIEEDMLKKVRANFKQMIVILNVGGIVDMSFIDKYTPDSVLLAWQGGMTGGTGTADILTGKVTPSGKLSDTIAYEISDYPSDKYFGDDVRNFYCEDIYVGYRYFETFAKGRVRFPFGFGLSYTDFTTEIISVTLRDNTISFDVKVKNVGKCNGKEVVQIYSQAPQGKLGKPLRNLIAFKKTKILSPNEEENLHIIADKISLSSYDDSGITGHKSCYVLEEGEYKFYMGTDVRTAKEVFSFTQAETIVTEQLEEALAPVLPFERFKPELCDGEYKVTLESTPISTIDMDERKNNSIPKAIGYSGDKGIKLCDVLTNKNSMEEFISQLSDYDLSCIIRGEGMGSPKVTAGTASAFGGVSPNLVKLGIPAVCCDDGPSGMRLDCGTKAFSLPNGTLCACTFNPELIEKLFEFTGTEMAENKVESLLGPGMNIHRHALNGRNFEYFSEDPVLTGVMAGAVLDGLHNSGVTGTIKHFAGNNQEKNRREIDSVISERALREIYLKAFEMVVKSNNADSVMTTYGSLNGLWTSGSYDLNTTILRKEWGFEGVVMTDWWAMINKRGEKPCYHDFATMARSQNDLYMVCPDGATNASGDNTEEALKSGDISRGELERCAKNICNFAMKTKAMERLMGTSDEIEIINRPKDDTDCDFGDLDYVKVDKQIAFPLNDKDSKAGTNYVFGLELTEPGRYKFTLTGSSNLGELAQIPCTLFYCGIPLVVFTFNGTNGKNVSISKSFYTDKNFSIIRLYVAQNGLQLSNLKIKLEAKKEDIPENERIIF